MSFLVFLLCIICVGIYQKSKFKNLEGIIVGNKIEEFTYLNQLTFCDTTFLNESMSTSYICKMFEQNASKICGNKLVSLSTLLKNKSYLILQFSMCDFLPYMKQNAYENKIDYDEELLSRQIQISLSFINSIINEIMTNNEALVVIHIGYYYPFSIYDAQAYEQLRMANQQYKQLAFDVSQTYIDIFDQTDKNQMIEKNLARILKG